MTITELSYPDLSRERYLAFDVETEDPGLDVYGTNAVHRARGGQLLGFSFYVPGGFNQYYQYTGPDTPTARWLADQVAKSPKVIGANTKYDLLWLLGEGLWGAHVAKRRYGDILINAALLNENAKGTYNLDGQANLYGFAPKKNDELLAAGRTIGLKTLKQVKCNMHLMQEHFPEVVAAYGNHDTYLTGKVWEAQLPLLDAEELTDVDSKWRRRRPEAMPAVEVEERFLPILVLMEAQGIRVDLDHAKAVQAQLVEAIDVQKQIIESHAGRVVNFNPSHSLSEYILSQYPDHPLGAPHKTTGKQTAQTSRAVLSRYTENPVIQAVLEARTLSKFNGTFVQSYILDSHINGRVYPNIYQIGAENESGEDGGTTTGRQAYANPNLQNIPIRNDIWGPTLRQMFIAEDGCQLGSFDFSQQEPRWAVTWAVRWNVQGAAAAAQEFINNPDADWHGQVGDMLGGPEWRGAGKVLVLARMYVQGYETCTAGMRAAGVAPENIPEAIRNFDEKMGFIKAASKIADDAAQKHGYVRTQSGRKRRFPLWEPKMHWKERQARKEAGLPAFPGLPRDQAIETYFNGMGKPIVRYKTYPAFNAVVQGSSADQTKQCAIQMFYEDDLLAAFHVHDEDVDSRIDSPERIERVKFHMLNTIKLEVPNKVGVKIGRYWLK
jgi:DNA polymerase I-like protein with 3'-5' exonuclease and polymerase domains